MIMFNPIKSEEKLILSHCQVRLQHLKCITHTKECSR